MTTINNTEETVVVLRNAMNTFPKLRLCQILSNAAKMDGWKNDDLFYISDAAIRKAVKKYIRSNK